MSLGVGMAILVVAVFVVLLLVKDSGGVSPEIKLRNIRPSLILPSSAIALTSRRAVGTTPVVRILW